MKQLQEILKPYFVEGQTEADITAVLKFIKSNGSFTIEFYDDGIGIVGKEDYFIPNKPLHLYSEEEDKQLLEILTNLVR